QVHGPHWRAVRIGAGGEGLRAAGPAEAVLDPVRVEPVAGKRLLATGQGEPLSGKEGEKQPLAAADRAVAADGLPGQVGIDRERHRPAMAASLEWHCLVSYRYTRASSRSEARSELPGSSTPMQPVRGRHRPSGPR